MKSTAPHPAKVSTNHGTTTVHLSTPLAPHNDAVPNKGDTVRRKKDGAMFVVTDRNAFGIKLEGHTGLFEPSGFTVT